MPEKVILCVDDEEIILEVLKEQLKRRLGNEYLIEVAQGGEEALALVEELSAEGFEIQMIIADQIMPGMKGDELLTTVHQKYPDTLKVFLTGRADAQAVGNAVNQANLYRYLAKPWDEEDLFLTVEAGLRSYQQDQRLAAQKEALQWQKDFVDLVIQTSPHLIFVKDKEGNFLLVNQATADLFGLSVEEVLQKNHAEVHNHPQEVAGYSEVDRKVIETGETQIVEEPFTTTEGEVKTYYTVKTPLVQPDGTVHILGIATDITERVHSQQENRLLREELAHVLRTATMAELATTLAHEITQPLTAIRSNAQAALRFMNTGAPDLNELREILDDIIADDRRATEVIIRMRALLKKQIVATEPLDINAVVDEVVGLLHSDAVIKNISMEWYLAEDLPTVRGDRIQLQQVLLNLILNSFDAMEAMPVGKRRLVLQTAWQDEKVVGVSIQDTGVGFKGQDPDRLFKPFHTTKAEGLGMGLTISRSIIEAHGGKIWARENPDRGATFQFTLPVISEVSP